MFCGADVSMRLFNSIRGSLASHGGPTEWIGPLAALDRRASGFAGNDALGAARDLEPPRCAGSLWASPEGRYREAEAQVTPPFSPP